VTKTMVRRQILLSVRLNHCSERYTSVVQRGSSWRLKWTKEHLDAYLASADVIIDQDDERA
jgi:hypothetical protein